MTSIESKYRQGFIKAYHNIIERENKKCVRMVVIGTLLFISLVILVELGVLN